MTVPPKCSASASASADLPLAVGPAMTTDRRPAFDARRRAACRQSAPGVGPQPMRMVVTLIAGRPPIAVFSRLAAAVGRGAGDRGRARLACAGRSLRSVPRRPRPGQRSRRRSARSSATPPVDILVQPVAGRRKRLLVADLEVDDHRKRDARRAGRDPRARRLKSPRSPGRAMNGEIDFAAALDGPRRFAGRDCRMRVLDEAAARIRLTPGARDAGRDDAPRRRGDRARHRRVHGLCRSGRRRARFRPRRRQPAGDRRRTASPARWRRRSSPARPSGETLLALAAELGIPLGADDRRRRRRQ